MKYSTGKTELSDYQRGWWDAMTEAMRIVGTHYVSYFQDPFHIPPREEPLMMSNKLRQLRENPPPDPEALQKPQPRVRKKE
jgi:hypothetical protein